MRLPPPLFPFPPPPLFLRATTLRRPSACRVRRSPRLRSAALRLPTTPPPRAGHAATTVCAVHDGYVLQKSLVRTPLAGRLLTRCMVEAAEKGGAVLRPRYASKRVEKTPGTFVLTPVNTNTTDSYKCAPSLPIAAARQQPRQRRAAAQAPLRSVPPAGPPSSHLPDPSNRPQTLKASNPEILKPSSPSRTLRRYCVDGIGADMKETLCRLADHGFDDAAAGAVPTVSYELPDGNTIQARAAARAAAAAAAALALFQAFRRRPAAARALPPLRLLSR